MTIGPKKEKHNTRYKIQEALFFVVIFTIMNKNCLGEGEELV